MNEATRKALEKAAENASAEDLKLTSIYLNGLKYAAAHPDSKAAALIKQINGIIENKGSRQDLVLLTYSLEDALAAAAWGMKE